MCKYIYDKKEPQKLLPLASQSTQYLLSSSCNILVNNSCRRFWIPFSLSSSALDFRFEAILPENAKIFWIFCGLIYYALVIFLSRIFFIFIHQIILILTAWSLSKKHLADCSVMFVLPKITIFNRIFVKSSQMTTINK